METLRNAAEVLLGYTTSTPEQSGKEPGTGSLEPGEGGTEPYDPGNIEENTEHPLAPANTTVDPPTSIGDGVALPGEAAFIGSPPTKTYDPAPTSVSEGVALPGEAAAFGAPPITTASESAFLCS